MLNIHSSLLPRWRGAAPTIHSLIKGDTQTGITIMKVAEKFDVGDIVTQEKVDIYADETRLELDMKLAKLGANVLIDVMEKLPQILSSSRPQGKIGITYAPKVTSKTCLVKWDEMTAKNVYDLQRALVGVYPLKTKLDGVTIKLLDVRQTSKPEDGRNADVPGFARFDRKNNALVVTCKGPSWISVKKVIVKGHLVMSALDFRNGFIRGRKKDWILFQSNIT
ncbi:methionyl-tRNA formyltransferase, mitochondrial isoform X2 [Monomorium pharaonis]|nr:methionyl-tRNA formyltransferase, mitochondrial isoform X2 [Monomorium pharaonis]